MRKLFYTMTMVLLCAGFVIAGMNDRHSKIDLTEQEQISIPAITIPSGTAYNTPRGNPRADRGWIYVIKNSGYLRTIFESDEGNRFILGNNVMDLPWENWVRYWTGSETRYDLGIGWNESGFDYPYRIAQNFTQAIVFPRLHPLDTDNWQRVSAGYEGVIASGYIPYETWQAVSPIMTQFRVPMNYETGDSMRLELIAEQWVNPIHTRNITNAAVRIGYDWTVNQVPGYFDGKPFTRPNTAFSTTYLKEYPVMSNDPVRVGTPGNFLSPTEVFLPLAMTQPTNTVKAGDMITVRIWRYRDSSVVDQLRILNARAQFSKEF